MVGLVLSVVVVFLTETTFFAAIFQLLSPFEIITHLLAQKGKIFVVTLQIG